MEYNLHSPQCTWILQIENIAIGAVEQHNAVSEHIERIWSRANYYSDHESVISEGVGRLDGEIDVADIGYVEAVQSHADDVHALVVIEVRKGEALVIRGWQRAVGIVKFDLD